MWISKWQVAAYFKSGESSATVRYCPLLSVTVAGGHLLQERRVVCQRRPRVARVGEGAERRRGGGAPLEPGVPGGTCQRCGGGGALCSTPLGPLAVAGVEDTTRLVLYTHMHACLSLWQLTDTKADDAMTRICGPCSYTKPYDRYTPNDCGFVNTSCFRPGGYLLTYLLTYLLVSRRPRPGGSNHKGSPLIS